MAKLQAIIDKTSARVTAEVYEAAVRTRHNSRHYLGMSEIGDPCDRALWLSFRGYPQNPIDGRVIMLFRFGDLIEQELIYFLQLAGYKITDTQLSVSTHNDLFRGHADGIIHGVTSSPHILECKSCNKKAFEAFKQAGVNATQPKYYCQVQCYMGYSGLDRALFAIQCKDDSAIYFERIYFNRSDFDMLHNRAYQIITANDPPNQQFNPDSFQCNWCRFRGYCWHPEDMIVAKQICGTCRYFEFIGLKRACLHPKHPSQIYQWGIGCPDWIERFSINPNCPDPVSKQEIILE